MKETFAEIFHELKLSSLSEKLSEFAGLFEIINEHYWVLYRKGMVSKEELRLKRIADTLANFGMYDKLIICTLSDLYLRRVTRKKNLFPGVKETLSYLKEKYNLYIISNGFAELQANKIESSEIGNFFTRVFVAEMSGFQKPDRRFFYYALSSVNAKKAESIMIGDDLEADIRGAKEAGIDQVFFNPCNKSYSIRVTYEIKAIPELRNIL
jgi:putative hydrolase of the HAD superfamily